MKCRTLLWAPLGASVAAVLLAVATADFLRRSEVGTPHQSAPTSSSSALLQPRVVVIYRPISLDPRDDPRFETEVLIEDLEGYHSPELETLRREIGAVHEQLEVY